MSENTTMAQKESVAELVRRLEQVADACETEPATEPDVKASFDYVATVVRLAITALVTLDENTRSTVCAYCGERFVSDADGQMTCVRGHIRVCESHPMRLLLAYAECSEAWEVWQDDPIGLGVRERTMAVFRSHGYTNDTLGRSGTWLHDLRRRALAAARGEGEGGGA